MPASGVAEKPVPVGAFDRVGAVAGEQAFDPAPLTRYLRDHIVGFTGRASVAQFHGGASNPTFLITDEGTGTRYVLRKKPAGDLLPKTHLIEREYRVMAALADTPVPVPRMLALCDDAAVIGTAFYVMPFLEGRIYSGNGLADRTPADRTATYRDIAATLAALHAVDPAAVGLGNFGRAENYFARQLARWSGQYRDTRTGDIPSMDALIARLPALIPAGDPVAIAHGDFRMENLMLALDEPRVLAVLDWELATLGHPLADLGFFCLFYHANFIGWNAGIDWAHDGIPTEDRFIADYVAAGGRDPGADWPFYLAFAAFRLAAIAQNVEHRGRRATGTVAPHRAGWPTAFADLAIRLLDRTS